MSYEKKNTCKHEISWGLNFSLLLGFQGPGTTHVQSLSHLQFSCCYVSKCLLGLKAHHLTLSWIHPIPFLFHCRFDCTPKCVFKGMTCKIVDC